MSGFLVPRVMQHKKNRHKKKMTSWRDSAMRSTCLPELDGRPWLLSTATVRLLMPPHQVLASGRSVQGDSTAGSDPPAAPRVTAKPTALAQGEPGRWASGPLPAGGAGPPGRPSLPGRDPGAKQYTHSSVPLPLACDPQAGVIDLQAGKKGAPRPPRQRRLSSAGGVIRGPRRTRPMFFPPGVGALLSSLALR